MKHADKMEALLNVWLEEQPPRPLRRQEPSPGSGAGRAQWMRCTSSGLDGCLGTTPPEICTSQWPGPGPAAGLRHVQNLALQKTEFCNLIPLLLLSTLRPSNISVGRVTNTVGKWSDEVDQTYASLFLFNRNVNLNTCTLSWVIMKGLTLPVGHH